MIRKTLIIHPWELTLLGRDRVAYVYHINVHVKEVKLGEKTNRKCFTDEGWGRLHRADDPNLNKEYSHRDRTHS